MKFLFTEHFKKQLKKLHKKYPHVKEDLLDVVESFNPQHEISIGRSIFKIRIPSRDMKKGKSGGFRAYIYFYTYKNLLIPLCIYAKSNLENISDNELQYHFDQIIKESVGLF